MLLGKSTVFKKLLRTLRRVAATDATVLLAGEAGSGRKLVARALHAASARRGGKFVTVECPAIPEGLLEAELFGHQAGAFTGAARARIGRLEEANGGTLFLDAVDGLPLRAQTSLLRAIESKDVLPLGASRPRQLDFRVVASAPPDLSAHVDGGVFRHDLYYRLKVIELALPPLRERRGDIELLATAFLRQLRREYGKPVERFSPRALAVLERYHWPGNIRELRNVVEVALASTPGTVVREADLPVRLRAPPPAPPARQSAAADDDAGTNGGQRSGFREQVRDFERRLLLRSLGKNRWDTRRTADDLGLERHQLKYLCAKLGVRRPRV